MRAMFPWALPHPLRVIIRYAKVARRLPYHPLTDLAKILDLPLNESCDNSHSPPFPFTHSPYRYHDTLFTQHLTANNDSLPVFTSSGVQQERKV